MNKKILIGSLLVLTLLLLMPSIVANQHNIVEDANYQKFQEPVDDFFVFEDIKDNTGKLDIPKHLILFTLVMSMYLIRVARGFLGWGLSTHFSHLSSYETIYHPLLYLYSGLLIISGFCWFYGWITIAKYLGWNWPFEPVRA